MYDFITDFDNFEKFLPDQVTNWSSTGVECSFTVPNIGKLGLKMEKDDARKEVKYISTEGPASFELLFELASLPEDDTNLTVSAFVEAPAFMLLMISKPIKNFMSILLDKIKVLAEANLAKE